jgi:hypothetical protein
VYICATHEYFCTTVVSLFIMFICSFLSRIFLVCAWQPSSADSDLMSDSMSHYSKWTLDDQASSASDAMSEDSDSALDSGFYVDSSSESD